MYVPDDVICVELLPVFAFDHHVRVSSKVAGGVADGSGPRTLSAARFGICLKKKKWQKTFFLNCKKVIWQQNEKNTLLKNWQVRWEVSFPINWKIVAFHIEMRKTLHKKTGGNRSVLFAKENRKWQIVDRYYLQC